jgi:hypothetical protein
MLNALNFKRAKQANPNTKLRRASVDKKGAIFTGIELSDDVLAAASANTFTENEEEEDTKMEVAPAAVKYVPPYRIDPSSNGKYLCVEGRVPFDC